LLGSLAEAESYKNDKLKIGLAKEKHDAGFIEGIGPSLWRAGEVIELQPRSMNTSSYQEIIRSRWQERVQTCETGGVDVDRGLHQE